MKTIEIKSEKDLKDFVASNRRQIQNINGVEFSPLYPILDVSNKHAYYYDVESQGNKFLYPPFNVTLRG